MVKTRVEWWSFIAPAFGAFYFGADSAFARMSKCVKFC